MLTPAFIRLWLATFACFLSFGVLVVALPLYVKDTLAAGELAIGAAMGVASLTALLAGPPAGRIADRRGRRAVLLAGAALMAAGYVALLVEPALGGVMAIRLFAGVGEAAFIAAAYTAATDLAPPERRGEAVSLVTLASYGGLAVGPLIDVAVGDGRFGAAWLIAGGCVVLAGVLSATIGETREEPESAPPGWLPPRGAVFPGIVLLFALLGFGGFNAFAVLYARELGFERPGVVFAVLAGVVILVRSAGRKIPDRLGARRATAAAAVFVAAGLATIGIWQTEVGMLVGTAVFAFGQSLAFPAIILLAIERTSSAERSAVVGSVTAFVDVALAGGAFTLGAVAAVAGYEGSFLAAAGVAAAALVLVARVRPAQPAET